ncbi:hypothetical protein DRO69_07515 [Candidatus Bathyarchaeota archaeon]|nr:MAG: hypothetical protein DRO69_07515 [Candidatus Bathyarchaeota archaeon]
MIYGWTNTILHIDLTSGKISKTSSKPYIREFLGGRGVNVKLLYELTKPGQNPLDPQSPIILGWGPLVGSGIIGGNQTEITFRTYPNGLYGTANFGGQLGPEMKFAGYDHVIITGRASKPTYIYIENDNIELRDASGLWGKDTFETPDLIKEEIGDPDIKVLCIGPAGEKLVAFASIEHNYRAAAGHGAGAIMGSKNLKAIAVRGTKGIKVYDAEKILQINEELVNRGKEVGEKKLKEVEEEIERRREGKETNWIVKRKLGASIGNLNGFSEAGLSWDDIEKTNPIVFKEEQKGAQGFYPCYACPSIWRWLDCPWMVKVPGDGVMVLGCMSWYVYRMYTSDMKTLLEADMLMSRYGLDHQSIMGTISWLMQIYDKGIISAKDTDGIPMEKGSREAILTTIHKIANREGFGNILADGALAFAQKLGKEAEYYLIHKKGLLQSVSYDYRVHVNRALSTAVDTRGDTIRSSSGLFTPTVMYFKGTHYNNPELVREALRLAKEAYGTEKAATPWEYEGVENLVRMYQDFCLAGDITGECIFVFRGIYEFKADSFQPEVRELFANMVSAATGVNITADELWRICNKVITLERAWNIREGHKGREDDTIPRRLLEERLPDGPFKGYTLNKEKLEELKSRYYALRGWDIETGIPTRETLEKYNLKDVADDLEKLGKLPKTKEA